MSDTVDTQKQQLKWGRLGRLKHELQSLRDMLRRFKKFGIFMKVNTCIEILDSIILSEDDYE